jgi:hypothetical protein
MCFYLLKLFRTYEKVDTFITQPIHCEEIFRLTGFFIYQLLFFLPNRFQTIYAGRPLEKHPDLS